ATLSIASMFRRRIFFLTIASIIWLALGITNGIILSNRMTPFTVYDLQSLKDGLSIATNYLSPVQIVLGGIGIILLVIGIISLWRKAPKKEERVH
ncbi:hypothetical protein RFZ44_08010, partial [Acinetobacter sp. 163]|nr:hypothetical protein [Acinetobacter sp. 163]